MKSVRKHTSTPGLDMVLYNVRDGDNYFVNEEAGIFNITKAAEWAQQNIPVQMIPITPSAAIESLRRTDLDTEELASLTGLFKFQPLLLLEIDEEGQRLMLEGACRLHILVERREVEFAAWVIPFAMLDNFRIDIYLEFFGQRRRMGAKEFLFHMDAANARLTH